ncbi:hypothetical protein CH367_19925 [Leptospira barantonii]|uniref:Uncharacterized protein n=1 Tax=Leptospira barantonii TaxID=2023184 RepID=A0ABX4NFA5_9LEPT|nr:hypothetical protein CH367_19925 [Leptospira barantonii]
MHRILFLSNEVGTPTITLKNYTCKKYNFLILEKSPKIPTRPASTTQFRVGALRIFLKNRRNSYKTFDPRVD